MTDVTEPHLSCDHGVVHKEVLGYILCVCCSHCQKELAAKEIEIESLRTRNKELEKASAEISGRNVSLHLENLDLKREVKGYREALKHIQFMDCKGCAKEANEALHPSEGK